MTLLKHIKPWINLKEAIFMTYKYPFYDYWLDKTTEAAIYNALKPPRSIKVAFL